MPTADNYNLSHNNNKVWIVTRNRLSDIELSAVIDEKVDGPYKEYKISDFCRYLLNPHSIEVKKKLIGCEIHYRQRAFDRIWNSFQKILSTSSLKRKKNGPHSPEMVVSSVIPSYAQVPVDANHTQHHIARVRGYAIRFLPADHVPDEST